MFDYVPERISEEFVQMNSNNKLVIRCNFYLPQKYSKYVIVWIIEMVVTLSQIIFSLFPLFQIQRNNSSIETANGTTNDNNGGCTDMVT